MQVDYAAYLKALARKSPAEPRPGGSQPPRGAAVLPVAPGGPAGPRVYCDDRSAPPGGSAPGDVVRITDPAPAPTPPPAPAGFLADMGQWFRASGALVGDLFGVVTGGIATGSHLLLWVAIGVLAWHEFGGTLPRPGPPAPRPGPSTPGGQLARAFIPLHAAALGHAYDKLIVPLKSGTLPIDLTVPDQQFKQAHADLENAAFAQACMPAFEQIVPAGTLVDTEDKRQRLLKLTTDFQSGLLGAN